MVRLVFRPYTQVGRPICTSGPLRTSTRVSSGFALPRHSSPSFGSCHARSCSTSPAGRARRAGGAPAGRRRRRDPTSAGAPRPSPSLRRRVSFERPSDSRACQTPWSVFQDGSGGTPTSPRTPGAREAWALPPRRRGAAGAHWVQSAPVDSRAGSGGPRPPSPPRFPPPRGAGGAGRFSGGRARRRSSPSAPGHGDCSCRGGAVTPGATWIGRRRGEPEPPPALAARPRPATFPPEAFPAGPEPVAAHRRGGNAPCGGRSRRSRVLPVGAAPGPARGGAGRRGSPTGSRRPTLARRVESSGRTARTPPVYLLTVSRPLELSLQSSFQLSLTVLVRYRSRARV